MMTVEPNIFTDMIFQTGFLFPDKAGSRTRLVATMQTNSYIML